MLYRGQSSVGAVPSVEKNSALCVSVEDLGRMFGFTPKRNDDELTLTRGNAQIRISIGATAGWYGYSIIPLYSAPFEQGGKFWVDSQSAAALFQGFSGRGVNNRLRFAKISGGATAFNENDFGDFGDFGDTDNTQVAKKPEPQIDLNAIINRTVNTNRTPTRTQPTQPTPTRPVEVAQPTPTQPVQVARTPQPQPT
ncbi:MAG: hypothetical protein IJL18_03090, partial [Synergistaceae bacterium]|nr:hypothetical protein [Synergistaceae bacterium]